MEECKLITKQTPDTCTSREIDRLIGLRVSAIHRREKDSGQCLGRGDTDSINVEESGSTFCTNMVTSVTESGREKKVGQ